jgi:predicted TPR repeat methyltransferase
MVAPVELLYSTGTKGMVQGETPLMCHEGLTDTFYDDILFQRVIVEEMGELLPAQLLSECDLSKAESILEIGSGAGEWLRAVAHVYPHLHCIGIDQDARMVKAANVLAQRDHLAQVAFSRRNSMRYSRPSFRREALTSSISVCSVDIS